MHGMYCAVALQELAWSGRRPAGPYVVVRDGRVFDAAVAVFDRGVDWGMPAAELRWRVPDVPLVAWRPGLFEETARTLRETLERTGTGSSVEDERGGVVGLPAPTAEDWAALVRTLVPHRAGRVRGGLAPHPLLARWVARAGPGLGLEAWAVPGGCLWVCGPEAAERIWATVPLGILPVRATERRRWRQLGFRRVGDVPGLARRWAQAVAPRWAGEETVTVELRFEAPLEEGLTAAVDELARRLAEDLGRRHQAARTVRAVWTPEQGPPVVRRRTWPTAAVARRDWMARIWGLLQPWPSVAPMALALEARDLEPAVPVQERWGFAGGTPLRARPPDAAVVPILSLYERRWQYWDPLRRIRATEG
ncbi:MAG: hypothetical protein K6V97_07935 [Actinomycetia bacterium]|nr:hypothetical protein [Actinomycetes bacterium]